MSYLKLIKKFAIKSVLCSSIICTGFSPALTNAGHVLDRIDKSGEVVIGYRPGWAPFSYEGGVGEIIGYGIDICRNIVAGIEANLKKPLKIKYVPTKIPERIPFVMSDKIDFECSETTNTPARREQVAFGITYFYSGVQMMVRKSDVNTIGSSNTPKTIGVIKGTTVEQMFKSVMAKMPPNSTSKTYITTEEALNDLQAKKIDGVLQDDIQLAQLSRAYKEPMTLIGAQLTIEPLSLIFNKKDAEINEIVQKQMLSLYRSGGMKKLYQKWFQSPLPVRGYNLELHLNPLLGDNFRRPSNYVTDWTVL